MVHIEVDSPDRNSRRLEPVTCGIPWPRGALWDPAFLSMHCERGRRIPLQVRTLESWPDGSVRWALLDWQADIAAEATARYRIEIGKEASGGVGSPKVQTSQEAARLSIDTGVAQFTIRS